MRTLTSIGAAALIIMPFSLACTVTEPDCSDRSSRYDTVEVVDGARVDAALADDVLSSVECAQLCGLDPSRPVECTDLGPASGAGGGNGGPGADGGGGAGGEGGGGPVRSVRCVVPPESLCDEP